MLSLPSSQDMLPLRLLSNDERERVVQEFDDVFDEGDTRVIKLGSAASFTPLYFAFKSSNYSNNQVLRRAGAKAISPFVLSGERRRHYRPVNESWYVLKCTEDPEILLDRPGISATTTTAVLASIFGYSTTWNLQMPYTPSRAFAISDAELSDAAATAWPLAADQLIGWDGKSQRTCWRLHRRGNEFILGLTSSLLASLEEIWYFLYELPTVQAIALLCSEPADAELAMGFTPPWRQVKARDSECLPASYPVVATRGKLLGRLDIPNRGEMHTIVESSCTWLPEFISKDAHMLATPELQALVCPELGFESTDAIVNAAPRIDAGLP